MRQLKDKDYVFVTENTLVADDGTSYIHWELVLGIDEKEIVIDSGARSVMQEGLAKIIKLNKIV